jgi:hypothetical protein
VKSLKLGVLMCGALGLAGVVMSDIGAMLETDKVNTVLMFAAFGLPVVMAVMALARPPLQGWQAGVALAGFVLASVKLRIWQMIKLIADVPAELALMLVGAALGAILSVLAAVQPEKHDWP